MIRTPHEHFKQDHYQSLIGGEEGDGKYELGIGTGTIKSFGELELVIGN